MSSSPDLFNESLLGNPAEEVLEAVIKGISSIDLTGMPLETRQEAYEFVLNYGYDLNVPQDAEEVRGFFQDAISFIENRFLSNEVDWAALGETSLSCTSVPSHIIQSGDVLDLLLLAAKGEGVDRHWACAILKIMHTIAHIHNGPLYKYFDEARNQILSRFHSIITSQGNSRVLVGSSPELSLPLYGFETKDQKTRESILVKLLCKKENVAEEVHDLIGVRLITHTPAEAILAISILRDQKVIIFPNIIPSRSRNTLIDLERFKTGYDNLLAQQQEGNLSPKELQALFNGLNVYPLNSFSEHNPSSAQGYRSIHITCRQLIRLYNPQTGMENRFFFPYEIQVLDEASYLESKAGSSAHAVYKKKQLATARKRVLGKLLKTTSLLANTSTDIVYANPS